VVGGLVFSQVMTLYITPVYYVYLERLQQWTRRIMRKGNRLQRRIAEEEEILAQSHD
jgi:HAE1 family hydrophobic/amphiphilic exporter-1